MDHIYPLPRIDETIASLHTAKIYTKFNVMWGFKNIFLDKDSQKYAAIISEYGVHKPEPMTSCHSWFAVYQAFDNPHHVCLGDKSYILAPGTGQVILQVKLRDGEERLMMLCDVYYVPNLDGSLLSISHLTRHKYQITFDTARFEINDPQGQLVAQGIESQGLFIVKALAYVEHAYNITVHHPSKIHNPTPLTLAARVCESYADLTTWHWQLGHANHNAICYLAKSGLVKGMRL